MEMDGARKGGKPQQKEAFSLCSNCLRSYENSWQQLTAEDLKEIWELSSPEQRHKLWEILWNMQIYDKTWSALQPLSDICWECSKIWHC